MTVGTAKSPNGSIEASAVSKKLVGENLNRRFLIVSNPSAKIVWLSPSSKAEAGKGIWLKPESGAIFLPGEGSDEGYNGEWTIITTEGNAVIPYCEL